MDFTRDPIIETIITPREGFKLVIRSSKGVAQEEFFVDAVEVVSFGSALFFRSLERPKSFMVPVTDYEVLEVREARMVLKNVGSDKTIKIGGGKEASGRGSKEGTKREKEKKETDKKELEKKEKEIEVSPAKGETEVKPERKRERRRQSRRRRGKDDKESSSKDVKDENATQPESVTDISIQEPHEEEVVDHEERSRRMAEMLPPPSELISETLDRYRDNELFKGVFEDSPDSGDSSEKEALISDDTETSQATSLNPSEEESEALPETRTKATQRVAIDAESSEEQDSGIVLPMSDPLPSGSAEASTKPSSSGISEE